MIFFLIGASIVDIVLNNKQAINHEILIYTIIWDFVSVVSCDICRAADGTWPHETPQILVHKERKQSEQHLMHLT
jgi:hypothetical protein